jgi:ubiquinone/menaquinone biosynthesis C-methylase UbiE
MTTNIKEVRDFWDANPCNSNWSIQQERRRYFEEITYKRFHGREWHVPIIAKFEKFKDKDVLEIGCGIGTDGQEFAKNGVRYVGIDLSANSIALAKERFDLFNVKGTFKVVNAEEGLPFPDNSFDHIYSFGVIHHTPNPEAIVDEIYRVLRCAGTITVMLYNRSSINYYVEIMFLRKLFRYILYPKFMPCFLSKITGLDEWRLNGHREILMRKRKMSKQDWITINTDGPYCPLSRVYNKREAAELFKNFDNLRQEVWEFNTEHWSFIGKLIPMKVAQSIGRMWGWHRVIYGEKQEIRKT